jgi:hypothetical protein
LEFISNLGACVAAFTYAVVLLRHEDRPVAHTRFAWLLVCVGAALGARALYSVEHTALVHMLEFVPFALFPLLAGLFVESVLRVVLWRALKVLLLAGALGFACSAFVPGLVNVPAWAWSFGAFHVVTVGALLVRIAMVALHAPRGPLRAVATSLWWGGLLAMVGVASDWVLALAFQGPQLGAAGVYPLLYLVASSLHGQGRWRFRDSLWRLFEIVALAAVAGVLVVLLDPHMHALDGVVVVVVIAFGVMVTDPVRTAIVSGQVGEGDTLLARVTALPTTSLEVFLAAMRAWPEIKSLTLWSRAQLHEQGLDRLEAFFASNPGPAEAEQVRYAVQWQSAGDDVRAAEQVLHLLESHDAQHAVLLPGGAVLLVSFEAFLDAARHRAVLPLAGGIAGLLVQQERA